MPDPKISIDYEGDCTCPNDHAHGELDELVAKGVDVHFEMMDQCEWWIGIIDPRSGRSWSIRCGSVSGRAKGYSSIEEETQP